MKRHTFGSTDLRVSAYGLGCARIGGVFQGDTRGHLDLLAAARDAGINFFDTADMYSQGESERLVGRAFRGVRDRVIIATKAGYCLPGRRRLLARLKPLLRPLVRLARLRRDRLPGAVRGTITQDFSSAYLRSAVEASLRRLRTDHIDLLQLHSPPLEVVERGDWHGALEDLKRRGHIRYYGVSCDSVDVGLATLRFPGISSVQFLLSLLEPRAAEVLAPKLASEGVAGIARECLANGLLVKDRAEIDLTKYTSSEEERRSRELDLERLRGEAAKRGVSLTRLAVEYPPSVPGVAVTLLGARSTAQLVRLLSELRS
jgi:aryl-alcohol dehydrogenase-like predicted oxidoreductase